MECAVVLDDRKVVPTNAGILFFGHEPQIHIMQSEIDCVLFRGAMGTSRYTDKKVITMGYTYGKHNEEYACEASGREREHNYQQ